MHLQKTGQIACHKQIAEVAKVICGELYERLMGDDRFYKAWRNENQGSTIKQMEDRFIERNWTRCVGSARTSLVMILKDPSISEAIKEEVVDILERDRSLVRGRGSYVGRAPAA